MPRTIRLVGVGERRNLFSAGSGVSPSLKQIRRTLRLTKTLLVASKRHIFWHFLRFSA